MEQSKPALVLTLTNMSTAFWEVSRCWNDPKRAARKKMSVERAVKVLRDIRTASFFMEGGTRLSKRASALIAEIVRLQVDEVEFSVAEG